MTTSSKIIIFFFFISFILLVFLQKTFCAQTSFQIFDSTTPQVAQAEYDQTANRLINLKMSTETAVDCGIFRKIPFMCWPLEMTEIEAIEKERNEQFRIDAFATPPFATPLPLLKDGILTGLQLNTSPSEFEEFIFFPSHQLLNPQFTWVPLEEVQEGKSTIGDWSNLANDDINYGCFQQDNGEICSRLINAWSSDGETKVKGLAVCNVTREFINEIDPTNCKFIALFQGNGTLIKAATYFSFEPSPPPPSMWGRTDFTIDIINFTENKELISNETLNQCIRKALEEPPLNLSLSLDGNDLIGTKTQTFSDLFKKWTIETVRVDISRNSHSDDLILWIATTLIVSPQNSANLSDWSLPTSQEDRQYLEKIKDNMSIFLPRVCPKGSWIDRGKRCEVLCKENFEPLTPPQDFKYQDNQSIIQSVPKFEQNSGCP